MNNYSSQVN